MKRILLFAALSLATVALVAQGAAPPLEHLAVTAGVGGGDVDAVFVNVQSDVQRARFVHGPSPCKFATT